MGKRNRLLLLILPIFATLVVSCGSSRNTASLVKKTPVGGESVSKNQTVTIPQSLAPQSQALLKEASSWLGTPYRYGGTDKGGVDCSGLVSQVYKSALSIKLPRNSKAQSDYCTPTPKGELVPGDLLFFATGKGKNVSHVGIFIGDNRMIHSSASKGVIISDINADYYTRTFTGSGRVDQYHAMISNGKRKNEIESIPVPENPIVNEELPTASIEKTDDTPFKFTPVSALPVKENTPTETDKNVATAKEQEKVKSAKVQPATTPITVAKSTDNTPKEISAEEARNSVLNSIIEQKLDSIYSK